MAELRFRKAKKVIQTYKTAYDFADDVENLKIFPPSMIERVKSSAMQNAFMLCMPGTKIDFGNGYMLECVKSED